MAWALPVNLQSEDWIFLKTLFVPLPPRCPGKTCAAVDCHKNATDESVIPRSDVPLLTRSLTHSVHLIALDSLRHHRRPRAPNREKEKVGQESDDTEEKPGSACPAVFTSRIRLFSLLFLTIYYLLPRIESKQ